MQIDRGGVVEPLNGRWYSMESNAMMMLAGRIASGWCNAMTEEERGRAKQRSSRVENRTATSPPKTKQ